MQARYDSLAEKYNQCKLKYTETFVEMNNKLVELQKSKKDVESQWGSISNATNT